MRGLPPTAQCSCSRFNGRTAAVGPENAYFSEVVLLRMPDTQLSPGTRTVGTADDSKSRRWKTAQQYERGYWQARADEMAKGASAQLDWYKWRAEQFAGRLERLGLGELYTDSVRVLEVGSGPIGVATYCKGARRVLVDPLQDYYASNPVLRTHRSPSAEYLTGVGEALPCPDSEFDLAMIENCIDHVQDVDGVMRELRRALRPGGILYLTVNCRAPLGYYVHRVLSRLRIDPGHPHTFTPDRAVRLLRRYGFTVLDVEVGSYKDARAEDLSSASSRARMKARLGVSEFVTSVVARREG